MNSQKKCRFINLAEQLAEHNEIVGLTMESLLAKVTQDTDVESRSDYREIQKTTESSKVFRPHSAKNSPHQNVTAE